MLVLGITGGHDSNWCIVRDGVLLGSFEKERFTRIRHDRGNVLPHISETLEFLGISLDDIDLIATSKPVLANSEPGFTLVSGKEYDRIDEWQHQIVEMFGRKYPCVSIPHHVAHAAYAYFTGRSRESSVVTWDGGGDYYTRNAFATTTVSHWSNGRLGWMENLLEACFGHLWFAYSEAVFGDVNSAGKLMGLAALGDNSLHQEFEDKYLINSWKMPGRPEVIQNCLLVDDGEAPRKFKGAPWTEPRAQRMASAVQHVTTRAGVSLVESLHKMTGDRAVALGGGVALNGYLNQAILERSGYDEVWIPPAVDDGGLSAGCALFATHHVHGEPFSPSGNRQDWARIGMSYSLSHSLRIVQESGVSYDVVEREEAAARVARNAERGLPVAWVEGRAEHGPRALGSRSLIAPAHSDRYRDFINHEVKHRESFRPLAPFVRESDSGSYFDIKSPSPYMMRIVDCKETARSEIPAVVHSDGTARVQTVRDDDSFGLILSAADEIGLPPVLINTSLNVQEAIVNSPEQALATFFRSPVSEMYLNGVWVNKKLPIPS